MFLWSFHKPEVDSIENWTIRTPIRRMLINDSGSCSQMTSRAVETSDFAFYKWHGYRGSRHMPITSVSHGFGRLNRNGGSSSSGHQSHHSKGGGSSPETSGDGLVHPRVGLPRFGDRWDKNFACLFVCLFWIMSDLFFVCFWLKSSIWSVSQSQILHVLQTHLFCSVVVYFFPVYIFALMSESKWDYVFFSQKHTFFPF